MRKDFHMKTIRNYLNRKGQGIVEYAVLLSFIMGLTMMLNGANLGGAVMGVFDDVTYVLARINGKSFDVPAAIAMLKDLTEVQKNDIYSAGGTGEGGTSINRGMLRSQWLKEGDGNAREIAGIKTKRDDSCHEKHVCGSTAGV